MSNSPAAETQVTEPGQTEQIYLMTAPIKAMPEINKDGCGWERATDENDYVNVTSAFSDRESVKALRGMVQATEGQDLARYCDNPDVKRIDVEIVNAHTAHFYFHMSKPQSAEDLSELREDFRAQLSDGWGEGFEQQDFDLEASSSSRHSSDEYKLGFSFDWEKLTPADPYNAETMRSLQDLENIRENKDSSHFRPR